MMVQNKRTRLKTAINNKKALISNNDMNKNFSE